MVKCPQCGTENLDGALFCDECGASLTEATAAPEAASTMEAAPPAEAPKAPPAEAPATPEAAPAVAALKCPSCGHENPPDARFCESCGAALTVPASTEAPPVEAPPVEVPPVAPPVAAPAAALVVADTGVELPLDLSKGESLIGRADPVSRVFPQVDLTPHGGYDAGVSRKHCRIFQQGGQFFVEDLGSTNGTKLNGQIIPPHQPRPLNNGDTLELGLLKLTFKVP